MKPENFWTLLDSITAINLKNIAVIKKYTKSQIVFQQDEVFTGFYIVKCGKFKVYKLKDNGKEIIINIMSSGNIIAAPLLFCPENVYPAYLEALEPGQLYYISEEAYISFSKNYPNFRDQLLSILSKYIINLKDRVSSLSLDTIEERIISYLRDLGAELNFVPLSISKKQLALLLNTTPETLSRTFRKMEEEERLISMNDTYKLMLLPCE
ncbi:MAG: Crp/Fnr family transcriptional regulator [Leptospiraceae bacterium]|nr:Crp/Fnr family transcriptional regulator [Leptospiraceae bacterium]